MAQPEKTTIITRPISLTPAQWDMLTGAAEGATHGHLGAEGSEESKAVAALLKRLQTPQAPSGLDGVPEGNLEVNPEVDTVTVYTDGACSGNPGPGGWGAVIVVRGPDGEEQRHELSGAMPEETTTNNRAELTAVVRVLEALPEGTRVTVVADSQYVIRGADEWLIRWFRNGWRNASRKPIPNRDLWEKIVALKGSREVAWVWTRGHAGNELNERANELARAAVPVA